MEGKLSVRKRRYMSFSWKLTIFCQQIPWQRNFQRCLDHARVRCRVNTISAQPQTYSLFKMHRNECRLRWGTKSSVNLSSWKNENPCTCNHANWMDKFRRWSCETKWTAQNLLNRKNLNKAVQREHFPLPTIEDVSTRLHGAKVFSKLDAK